MDWTNLFLSKKSKLNKYQLALLMEYYTNNPELSTYELSKLFNVGNKTADGYISKHLFGVIQGERVQITLPSKMNQN